MNMENPVISIITVCYNSEEHIESTIKSVLSQDYNRLQYIIVDGGSTDRTMNIVNKYKEKIDTIISEPDKGISDAFNKGICHAKGDLIGIVNSDDILLPNALLGIAQGYQADKYDIYRGNSIIWNPLSGYKYKEVPSMTFSKTPVFVNVAHESSFITKKAYEKYGGYDVKLHYCMDLDFFIRAYQNGARYKYVNTNVVQFRLGGATSTPILKKRKDYIKLARNNNSSCIRAYAYLCILVAIDIAKRTLDIISPELKKKIKYRHSSK